MEYSKPFGKPYKEHRQWHLGELMTLLRKRGRLTCEVEFPHRRPAVWSVSETDQPTKIVGTKDAEAIAQRLANAEEIVWIPVPHPGGIQHWKAIAERIEHMEEGHEPKPWEPDFV